MQDREFLYWLQGFFKIGQHGGANPLINGMNADQVNEIYNHLQLVFNKVTPNVVHNPIGSVQVTCRGTSILDNIKQDLRNEVKEQINSVNYLNHQSHASC